MSEGRTFLVALNRNLTDSTALAGDLPENLRDAMDSNLGAASAADDTDTLAVKQGANHRVQTFAAIKTWVKAWISKADVGLSNVANVDTTTQANVNFTSLTAAAAVSDTDTLAVNQGAGNLKQTFTAIKTWIKSWIVKADVGLGNVDNTSDATKNAASATLTNKTLTSPTINSGALSGTFTGGYTTTGVNVVSVASGATATVYQRWRPNDWSASNTEMYLYKASETDWQIASQNNAGTRTGNINLDSTTLTHNAIPIVTTTGTQTLTNKTLTSPTINGGALSGTFSGAHTITGLETIQASNATTFTAYLLFQPTDYGAGKPRLGIDKQTTADLWNIGLYDTVNNNGTLNFGVQNLTHNANPIATTGYRTISTDADATIAVTDRQVRHTGTLTAARSLTLSTSGAVTGAVQRITRTGSGAFNLNVGTGPLKALTTNTWCTVTFDGSAWYLSSYGAL